MFVTEAEQAFEAYLEKYCKTYGYNKEEAKEHLLVKCVQQYYEDSRK